MDYTQQKLVFKIKKAIRYIGLYGPTRTIIKVQAQYHMKKEFPQKEALPVPPHATGKHIGLLGCGKFAYSNIGY
ncbi:MAG: hypothetical protein EOO92_28195 [Pedobacter sp.]|nr:MAG: hypothetical protein EOO92_28195 [Pedobacter sp.]